MIKDYIILVHGFLRTSKSMKKLEQALLQEGYRVINVDYPSRKGTIEDFAENYLKKEWQTCCTDKNVKIHFVAHSMGGIIVRYFLAHNKIDNLGRVVLLAVPNKGAKLADFISKFKIINSIFGPAIRQLGTDKTSLANRIPPPNYEVGVIAGKYDEKVPVENTKLKNMKGFLLVPKMHTHIMDSEIVINAVKRFIENGQF